MGQIPVPFYYYGVSEQDSYVVCEVTCNNGSVIKHRLKNDSDSGVTKTHEYFNYRTGTGT